MGDVTNILCRLDAGDPTASGELLPLIYEELRQLAAAKLAQEKPGQTLQATALVHEAYLRLVGSNMGAEWNGRAHFFGAAAEAMRRILVESARRKGRNKRGGQWRRHDLSIAEPAVEDADVELLALDEVLSEFAKTEPAKAELVKLRYFAGLKLDEVAEALGISPATADRHWRYARAWLAEKLRDEPVKNDSSEEENRLRS